MPFRVGTNRIGRLVVGASSAYDSDALAFFTAVEGGGDTLTDTEKDAVNTLVVTLKADSIWDKMQVIYPIVGGTATSVKWNLADPQDTDAAYRMDVEGTGWTIDANGMKQSDDGSTYGDTHYAPNTNNASTGLHMSMYVNGGTNTRGYDFAANEGGTEVLLLSGFNNNNLAGKFEDEVLSNNTFTMPLGFFSITGNNNGSELYRNGTEVDSGTTARGTTVSLSLYLGRRNTDGAPAEATDRRYAFASLGEYLDATESSDLATAVEAFQTTLSREN